MAGFVDPDDAPELTEEWFKHAVPAFGALVNIIDRRKHPYRWRKVNERATAPVFSMTDLNDAAHQLNVLWKSGRDKYAAFFTVLGQVRQTVGDDAINAWCIHNLRLHIDTIVRVLGLLRDTDAQREKLALKPAIEAKRNAAAEERAIKAIEREAAQQKRLADHAEKQARREAAKAEKERERKNAIQRDSYHRRRQEALKLSREQTVVATAAAVEHIRASALLAECLELEKNNRVELGRRYAELQEIVESGQVGTNPATGHRWSWTAWAEQHINRSRKDIYRCIEEFAASCRNSQENPVKNIVRLNRA